MNDGVKLAGAAGAGCLMVMAAIAAKLVMVGLVVWTIVWVARQAWGS